MSEGSVLGEIKKRIAEGTMTREENREAIATDRSQDEARPTTPPYTPAAMLDNGHLRSEVRVVILRSGNGGGAEQGLY